MPFLHLASTEPFEIAAPVAAVPEIEKLLPIKELPPPPPPHDARRLVKTIETNIWFDRGCIMRVQLSYHNNNKRSRFRETH